jgi:hypothetical protein
MSSFLSLYCPDLLGPWDIKEDSNRGAFLNDRVIMSNYPLSLSLVGEAKACVNGSQIRKKEFGASQITIERKENLGVTDSFGTQDTLEICAGKGERDWVLNL